MQKKLCVLLSAGLDSFTCYHWLKQDKNRTKDLSFEEDVLFLQIVDTDSPYWHKEVTVMNKLYGEYGKTKNIQRITINGYGRLVTQEDSHVVLGRNAVYASIAAGIAPRVLLCGTAFEDNIEMYDKNSTFFDLISQTLSYACSYNRDDSTFIYSPFQDPLSEDLDIIGIWDKHQMIKWCEENEFKDWRKTISCFHEKHDRCGCCVVCGKRFIYEAYAEIKWGIKYSVYNELKFTYGVNPLHNEHLLQTWKKMLIAEKEQNFERYNKERIEIYRVVLEHYGVIKTEKESSDSS